MMAHRKVSEWKEEFFIIKCALCNKEIKAVSHNKKYCYECKRKKMKMNYVRKTKENYKMNLRRLK